MKKSILTILACMVLTACGTSTMTPDKMDINLEVPGNDWQVVSDEENSYVISEGSNLISCDITEISPNSDFAIPKTQEELTSSLGEEVASLSTISNFAYDNSTDTESVFYIQTINIDNSQSVIICRDTLKNTTRKTYTATLIDPSESDIEKISQTIKGI